MHPTAIATTTTTAIAAPAATEVPHAAHPAWLDLILGVAPPWRIERVDARAADGRIDVWVRHAAHALSSCPECGARLPCHDEVERVWRHLDLGELRTWMHARVPRVICPRHAVREVHAPWTGAGPLYTAAMERHIIALAEHAGIGSASRALQVGWSDAWALMMSRRVGV